MNYLAHFYLSFENEGLIIGNYLADDYKGKSYLKLPEEIKKGVVLHRTIDDLTDKHALVLEAKNRLREDLGKFTGVALDVFFDHFLAKHWQKFHQKPLNNYSTDIYELLNKHKTYYSTLNKKKLYYMSTFDWLKSYAHITGVKIALNGLSKRTIQPNTLKSSHKVLKNHYDFIEDIFMEFFPDLEQEILYKNL
ncbi:MAG: acyl carrier protein phosphodiesterase [Vicingaceae bacterium]